MFINETLNYLEAGFSLVPVYFGTKYPAKLILGGSWSQCQEQQPTADDVARWFDQAKDNRLNMAVVCGPISRNLLILDFDHEAQANFRRWQQLVRPLADHLPVVQTGKGFHVYMRVKSECRTLILARSAEGKVLVETRGRNNLCLLPGSKHPSGSYYRWVQGDETTIPLLNDRQLFHLVGAASMLNEQVEKVQVPRRRSDGTAATKHLDQYTQAALTAVIDELMKTTGGRNNALNGAAYRLGRFVGDGLIGRETVEAELRRACEANGYIDKDGEGAFLATMGSGLSAGIANPLGKVRG